MRLNESDMPGPSDEARQLQLTQYEASQACYEAMDVVREQNPGITFEAIGKHPLYLEKRAAYDGLVVQLEALLGASAHCNEVDCSLWSLFWDWFKEENGFRPRGMRYTRAQVLKQLAAPD